VLPWEFNSIIQICVLVKFTSVRARGNCLSIVFTMCVLTPVSTCEVFYGSARIVFVFVAFNNAIEFPEFTSVRLRVT
jgi:hypothetical protein